MREVRLWPCPHGTELPPFPKVPDPPMQVQLPDARWTDAWRAASHQLRGRHMWGGLAFEVGRVAQEMDMVGLHDEADKVYEHFLKAPGAKPDGDYADGNGALEWATSMRHDMGYSHDGTHASTGRLLFAMAERYFLTGDKEWFQRHRDAIAGGGRLDHSSAELLHEGRSQPAGPVGGRPHASVHAGRLRFAQLVTGAGTMRQRLFAPGTPAFRRRPGGVRCGGGPEVPRRGGGVSPGHSPGRGSGGCAVAGATRARRRVPQFHSMNAYTGGLMAWSWALLGVRNARLIVGGVAAGRAVCGAGRQRRPHGGHAGCHGGGGHLCRRRAANWRRRGSKKGLSTADAWFWNCYGGGLPKASHNANIYLLQDDVPNFLRFWMNSYAPMVGADGRFGKAGTWVSTPSASIPTTARPAGSWRTSATCW